VARQFAHDSTVSRGLIGRARRFLAKKDQRCRRVARTGRDFNHFRARIADCPECAMKPSRLASSSGLSVRVGVHSFRRAIPPKRGRDSATRNEVARKRDCTRLRRGVRECRVRAAHVPRQGVERGKNGDATRRKNGNKETQRFGDGFGLLVGGDEKNAGRRSSAARYAASKAFG